MFKPKAGVQKHHEIQAGSASQADERPPEANTAAVGDKCAQCVYFFPQYDKECRYNPPQVVVKHVAYPVIMYRNWPRVENDDWCGFFSKVLPAAYKERNK